MKTVQEFAERLEAEQIRRLKASHLDCETNVLNARVSIKPGKKYVKVDVGSSGKYMIDNEGNIFGVKAYGVIHKGHYFGNLDTIDDYFWGHYRAFKKQKKSV